MNSGVARVGKIAFTGILVVAILMGAGGSGASATSERVVADYGGIQVLGMIPPPGATYDVSILDPQSAVENIIKALALIDQQSPYSANRIAALKRNGTIQIIYDPRYPHKMTDLASLRIALFLPSYFQRPDSKPGKDFPVIIGRHGIKWPLPELAAVLVHELVGHGTQHLKGRLENMRTIDIECEAWLYQEVAFQDFGMDKFSNEMIEFRKQLDYNCDDFTRYLQNKTPAGYGLWNVLNPDVAKLLSLFENYLNDLRAQGTIKDTLAVAAKQNQEKRNKIFSEGSPQEQFQIALSLRIGAGQPLDLAAAAKWFRRAAEQGYARAQYELGILYLDGQGVTRNAEQSYFWLTQAVLHGDDETKTKALARRQIAIGALTTEQVQAAERRARAWRP